MECQPNSSIEAHLVKMQQTLFKMALNEDFRMYIEIPEEIYDKLTDGGKEEIGLFSKKIFDD